MDHRDNHGRFGPGNQYAKGHPSNAKAQAVRAALIESATPERMKTLIEQLWRDADDRDPEVRAPARKELLDRIVGKPQQAISMETTNTNSNLPDGMTEEVAVEILADALLRMEAEGELPKVMNRKRKEAACREKSPQKQG